ncbi:MAG: DEAD/DEAH box helicase [Actinobacteria bacterium]|nr:DEAD/DEAH box helicase [Actinomycetota bacterium]
MPDNARRRRAPAHQPSPSPAGRGQEGRRGGSEAGGRRGGGQPGRRNGPRRPRTPRPVRPAQPEPYAELDQALSDAAALPEPATQDFAALGLPERLIAELAAREIEAPFAIQRRALPDALAGRDVLGRAQTGSGKTLAFGLPLLTRLAGDHEGSGRRRPKAPRALVLVPTRELAQQVADVLGPLGRAIGVTVMTVYGGVTYTRQISRLRDGVDLVVATPGRLIDLLDQHACTLDEIEITVLDEADHMADLGFLPAVTRILDATPAGGQRMLFSATLDRRVGQLVTKYLSEPALHAVAPRQETATLAEHRVLVLPSHEEKLAVAIRLASRPARTLFFVRTKHGADRLARQLTRAGVAAEAIHGNRTQKQRQRALDAFALGHPRVLVATDVAARGIHVDDVELVVHFDPPNDHKDYLHRSGRTARAGASGLVVTLADESQLRELQLMHRAADVTASRHYVDARHQLVEEIATTGTPVPPAPPAPPASARGGSGSGGSGSGSGRPGRGPRGNGQRGQGSRRPRAGEAGGAGHRGPRRGNAGHSNRTRTPRPDAA